MSTDRAAFLNRVRSLFNIDGDQLPELDRDEWRSFRDDPVRFFMRADDWQAAAIWREVEKRQTRRQGETPGAPELLEAREAAQRTVDAFAWAAGYSVHANRPERDAFHAARALLSLTALQKVQATDGGDWRPIETAAKDRSTIWALLRSDIYPTLKPGRDDLERWNGLQVPLRHPGVTADGFDAGWNIAVPVGHGGFPDNWIAGWVPLRSLSSAAGKP